MRKHLSVSIAVSLALASSASVANAQAQARVWTQGMNNDTQYDSFIVKYRDGTRKALSPASAIREIDAASQRTRTKRSLGTATTLKHQRRLGSHADLVSTSVPLDRVDAEQLMHQIALDSDVEYVQPNYLMHAYATPNDTRYTEQWHYAASTGGARLPAAWDLSRGAGVVVGVVDSGYLDNDDLAANLLPGYDMVASTRPYSDASCTSAGYEPGCGGSDDNNGRDNDAFDSSGIAHGTHVAGTVAAVTNNQKGVAGVAYDARVVPVRVLGNQGVGSSADIIDGILWAAGITVSGAGANANPAEVINLSLGGVRACSPAEQQAINQIVARGTLVVVAAGNDNTDVANAAPANCNNVIAVAANDNKGNRAFYSNYGAGIHITAPGGETWSCRASAGEFLPLDTAPSQSNCAPTRDHPEQGVLSTVGSNGYDFMAGTSMAAPHVAGIVALIQARASTPKTTAQVKDILSRTARPIPAAQCPGGCGPGLVDAAAAVQAAN